MNTLSNAGTLYGVGVGPGDPELLTLKAVRIIQECEYIAIPSTTRESCIAYQIVLKALPAIAAKNCLLIEMPMTKDTSLLIQKHKEGASAIEKILKTGASVAFLTLGDPTVYSTYLYLHRMITDLHYSAAIISGIPSFCAAAAALNTGLVEGAEPLHIYPGSYPIEESLTLSGTKVYMKSGHQIASVRDALQQANVTASMIENCGMEQEHIYTSIEEIPEQSSYYSIILTKSES